MNAIRAEEQHVRDAIGWLVKRGMPELPPHVFSTTGFVVPNEAGLWLYLTNSSMAYLEMLISNPDAPKESRSRSLDVVIDAAVAFAIEQGCSTLLAPIEHEGVIRRAKVHGFNVVAPQVSLMALPLGGS